MASKLFWKDGRNTALKRAYSENASPKAHTPTNDQTGTPYARTMDTQYLAIAIQYYIAGRSATFAGSVPVAGNLFHHAVEMLLKFLLIKNSYSADQLKNKFKHDLNKLWSEVKSIVKDSSLNKFDELLSRLNDFEDLRYPGRGYTISISVYKCKLPEVANESAGTKQYQTCLEDIDEFVSSALAGRVNPEWIRGLMIGKDAIEQYKKDNKHPFFSLDQQTT